MAANVRKLRIYTIDPATGDAIAGYKEVDEYPTQGHEYGADEDRPSILVQDLNGNSLTTLVGKDWDDLNRQLEIWQTKYINNINTTGGGTSGETPEQKQDRLKAEQDAKDEKKRLADIIVGEGSLNDLEKALNDLINQNKSYYGNKQRALRLGEGETSAKAYGGKYDVDLNQNGTIEANERGAGNVDNTESVMGKASSSASNRLKQSGISDFNTLVENKNQRTEQDINSALMSLMNSNTNSLADLQNSQWGTEAGARTGRDEARRKYEAALGTTYRQSGYGDWISGSAPAAGTTAAGNETIKSAAATNNLDNLPFDAFMNNSQPPKPPDTDTYTWFWDSKKWVKINKLPNTTN